MELLLLSSGYLMPLFFFWVELHLEGFKTIAQSSRLLVVATDVSKTVSDHIAMEAMWKVV